MNDEEWREYRGRFIERLVEELDVANDKPLDEFTEDDWKKASEAYVSKYSDCETDHYPAHLKGFCRVYPRSNQDLMVVFAEPKLALSEEDNDNCVLASKEDMEEREKECMKGSYLNLKRGDTRPTTRIHKIIKETAKYAQESDTITFPELSTVDPDPDRKPDEEDIHEEVYVTNFHKFAADGNDNVDYESFEELSKEWLLREIETIDPDVVFVWGGKAWERVRNYLEPAEHSREKWDKEEIEDTNVTDARGYPFSLTLPDGSNPTVIPRVHPPRSSSDTDYIAERIIRVSDSNTES